MKKFDKDLLNKNILMLSDYVCENNYHKKELEDERFLIKKFKEEIEKYKLNFFYVEIKTLKELKAVLKNVNLPGTVIYNWCEEVDQKEGSGYLVAKYLSDNNYIFTGSDYKALKFANNKTDVKKILESNGILTPKFVEIKKIEDTKNINIPYPIIVKYNNLHSSVGISARNIVNNKRECVRICREMLEKKESSLIAETYIEGDEFLVGVWGFSSNLQVLPIVKVEFLDKNINDIQTYRAKFKLDSKQYKNTIYKFVDKKADSAIKKIVGNDALLAAKLLNLEGYSRFEFRGAGSKYYLIDANPNPALCQECFIFISAKVLGYNYGETILKLCEFALKKHFDSRK